MTFLESIKTVFGKYAEFSGRASRPEFWYWVLFTALVAIAINAFDAFAVGNDSSLGNVLGTVWGVATFVPSLAVTVRRLRDGGYHWANMFWVLLPIVGLFILIVFLAQPAEAKK